ASRPYIQRRVEFDLGPPTNSIPQGQTAATPATNMDLNDLDSSRKGADATVAPRASRLPTTGSSGNTFARDVAQLQFSSGQSQARWSGSSRISWKTSRGAGMSGARHRQKAVREERMLVGIARDSGFAAERVPLSGSVGRQRFSGDIVFPLLGHDLCVESKVGDNGFRQLYHWLQGRDLLVVRADRRAPLVVLPMRLPIEIGKAADGRK